MNKNKLFRQEAIENKKNKNYGSVSINIPQKYFLLTIGFTSLVICICLFLIFAEFSEKFIVKGYLNSSKGIVSIYPKKDGVIIQCYIHQGDQVKKGDELFLIDTSYAGINSKPKHNIRDQLKKNKQLINAEINYKKNHLQSLKKLLEKNYISQSAYHAKQEELLALEHKNNQLDMELIRDQQERSYVIRSPIDGFISTLIYQKGQYTNALKPLVKILPSDSDLIAELFIPVKHAGFLHKKNSIIVRYDAYPYERFGTTKAVITNISQSILIDKEEDKPISIGQPYYKVIASLDRQVVRVYGKDHKIQQGMTITAVIIGSKRKLWQWILDPLYSFYGELFI